MGTKTGSPAAGSECQHEIVERFSEGELDWELPVTKAWGVVMRGVLGAFYSHPWAWNEIGFGGPAYPRGYARLGAGQREHWEAPPEFAIDPVARRARAGARVRERLRVVLKGAQRPTENDSAFLLDPHRKGVPGRERMRRYKPEETVDMLIVGAGAGGATLAQRLARRDWRVLVLEAGPFWDPDEDWVSDEAGAHPLYWTEERIIGGEDPVDLGKNNSGRGVGGSMIHYAGFTPRFHPSDFEVYTRDGVGADWPIAYEDLKPHYERLERELPVAGEWWPWGDPHGYPHGPHPVGGGALRAWEGARRLGIEMRVGPVGITNGSFGHRPHCIYRGFCLQGCKVGAKASPLVTHIPDALEHGVEVRADCMVTRIETNEAGRAIGVTYFNDGQEHFQAADAVTVAGYSIETPRLLLHSTSSRFPNGLANENDLVGRGIMVQGAPQVAGRFPEEMRMYKAPPPEINCEQFYETDPGRGFARGFSIQTVGPLPIGWAEHVLADGHWGQALREYMRDYNHWYTIGCLSELLPRAENRVTLAEETDRNGMPVARLDYTPMRERPREHRLCQEQAPRNPQSRRSAGHS